MTTPIFPSVLPGVSMNNYSFTPVKNTIRTEMEAGLPRVRRRFLAVPTEMTVTWQLTIGQLAIFEQFYDVDAQCGAAWFYIKLVNGMGETSYLARFKEPFTAKAALREFQWEITATLETLERPLLGMTPVEPVEDPSDPTGTTSKLVSIRPILQSGIRSYSDSVGTWAQSGTVITLSVASHGAVVGDNWAFNPAAGTGTLATAGIYIVQTVPDTNTITLQSATSSSGSGTMTGTGAQTVYSGTIPGGVMGKNGSLRVMIRHRHTNSANAKTFEVYFGGVRFTQWTLTTSLTSGIMGWIMNLNSEQVQQLPTGQGSGTALGAGNFNNSGGDWTTAAVDTSVDQPLVIKITKAVGSESAAVANLTVELIPSKD